MRELTEIQLRMELPLTREEDSKESPVMMVTCSIVRQVKRVALMRLVFVAFRRTSK